MELKSVRRENKRRKSLRMKVVGAGNRLLQQIIMKKAQVK